MKSFKQFLIEANPYTDLEFRKIAQEYWNKLYSSVRSKKAVNLLDPFDERQSIYGQYLYKLIGEAKKQENNIMIIFSPVVRGEVAAFSVKKLTTGNKVSVMFLSLNNFVGLDLFTAQFLAERQKLQDAFFHEFIHFLDSIRIGDKFPQVIKTAAKHSEAAAKDGKDTKGLQQYFNSPMELNAWMQTANNNFERKIDETFEQFFDMLHRVRTAKELDGVIKKSDKPIKEMVNSDFKNFTQYYKHYGFPGDDSLFVRMLNDKNYKKFMQRMYQYYQYIFKPKMKQNYDKYQMIIAKRKKELR